MAASGGTKRITKELAECTKEPPDGMKIRLVEESSIYKWEVVLDGPSGTPYSGGHFKVHVNLPVEYPFKPPVLAFQTKIYHPNVTNDDKGAMCLGILRSDEWKPPNRIMAVLNMLRSLLAEPNIEDAVETAIADQYKNSRKEFDKAAKEWTKRYAGKK